MNVPACRVGSGYARPALPRSARSSTPWFVFPIDALGAMRSGEHTRVLDEGEGDAMLRRTRMGNHRAVAALASVGNDVIMDYPLGALALGGPA